MAAVLTDCACRTDGPGEKPVFIPSFLPTSPFFPLARSWEYDIGPGVTHVLK